MKILFVLEYFHPYIGGVEHLFWELSKALATQGHQVKVITTRFDKKLPQKECKDGIDIYRVNCDNRFSFFIKSVPSIFKNSKDFDVVHTTTYTAAPPAWLVSRLRNKKSVLTFHEYWGDLWKQVPYLNRRQRILYSAFERMVSYLPFSKIVAVSKFTQQSLIKAGVNQSKIRVIYNGLDYNFIEQINAKIAISDVKTTKKRATLNYLFVGRLGVSKGLDLLLEASAIFLQKNPEATLKLVIPKLPKKMYALILNKINSLPCMHQITVMHHLTKEELYKQIKQASFIVIPSYSEGFCFVAAEACALNVPIISSDRGALKEVVSGQYIPMNSLTTKGLLEALQNAKQQKWHYKDSVRFSLDKSVEQYVHLYKEMIDG
ncbi:glycosyltransferase family 4 protein [Dokdonia ponticola]|uniref:Glycosyltransferase family 4 protein n=1 Tax=Dokdonia ponticola TaxID=2041041 RepID=A0ABV9HVU0_9FLAO